MFDPARARFLREQRRPDGQRPCGIIDFEYACPTSDLLVPSLVTISRSGRHRGCRHSLLHPAEAYPLRGRVIPEWPYLEPGTVDRSLARSGAPLPPPFP